MGPGSGARTRETVNSEARTRETVNKFQMEPLPVFSHPVAAVPKGLRLVFLHAQVFHQCIHKPVIRLAE